MIGTGDPEGRVQGRRLRDAGRRASRAARAWSARTSCWRTRRSSSSRARRSTPSRRRDVRVLVRRQSRQHQRLHRDEVRAVAAEEELHRDAAPRSQPRAVAARRQDRQAGRRDREARASGATTRRRCTPTTASRPSSGQSVKDMINDENWNRTRLPAHRRQARRGDHRGRAACRRPRRPPTRRSTTSATGRRAADGTVGDDGRASDGSYGIPHGRDVRRAGDDRRRRIHARHGSADRRRSRARR